MQQSIHDFLDLIDQELARVAGPGERLEIYHIGRSALMFHHGSTAGTKDLDMIQMNTRLEQHAEQIFGGASENAKTLSLYLQLVPQGIPPVPQSFRKRCVEIVGGWRIVRLWRLDPHDLAATKMKRFEARDREDLRFLCDEGHLNEERLRMSLESAFMWTNEEDADRERAFSNLETVCAYLRGERSSV